MRTTLALDDDAAEAIRMHARKRGLSRGKAASDLIRRGARYQLAVRRLNGLPVLDAPAGFPAISTKRVRDLLAEE